MKVQELKLWGTVYKNMQEEAGLKWEEDQDRLLKQLQKVK